MLDTLSYKNLLFYVLMHFLDTNLCQMIIFIFIFLKSNEGKLAVDSGQMQWTSWYMAQLF